MEHNNLSTDFASPERSSDYELDNDINYFKTLEGVTTFLNAVPNVILVLNKNRQVVYANRSILSISDAQSLNGIYGKRPGEIFDCLYSDTNSSGCGTSVFCRNCTGVHSILKCLDGEQNSMECTIIRKNNKPAFDLRVTSCPFEANGSFYVIFTATDISHEKRRRLLEHSFFHDIANSLTGVRGYGDLMDRPGAEFNKKWLRNLRLCTEEAINEINLHKALLAAEDGDLNLEKKEIKTEEIILMLKKMLGGYSFFKNCDIPVIIDPESAMTSFKTDATILSRVLINLVKNAVEASECSPVRIGCFMERGKIVFYVKNRTFINEAVQTQIFKRSFSTKGKGRGIGTYSVKLLTEKYLDGKVYFNSDENEGTTFFVELPV